MRAALLTVPPKKSRREFRVTARQLPLWIPILSTAAPLTSFRLLNTVNSFRASRAVLSASELLRNVAITASPIVFTTVPLFFLIRLNRMMKCSLTMRYAPPSPRRS